MNKSRLLIITFSVILFLPILGCKENIQQQIPKVESKRYNHRIELIESNIDSIRKEVTQVYIDSENDTLINQKYAYERDSIKLSASYFYELELNRDNNENSLNGKITYPNNSLIDGEIMSMSFTAISKFNDTVDFKSFEKSNSNSLDFRFPNDSDTLIAALYIQFNKDTLIKGERMIRNRQRLFLVDNYTKTNNPFIEISLE